MNTIKALKHEITKIANENGLCNIRMEIVTHLSSENEYYTIYHTTDWDKHTIIESHNEQDLITEFKNYATKNRN